MEMRGFILDGAFVVQDTSSHGAILPLQGAEREVMSRVSNVERR